MSRYKFPLDEKHDIVLGWDNPVQSFFMQVWSHENDEEPVASIGNLPRQATTVKKLQEFAKIHGVVIPDYLCEKLERDYEQRTELTALQKRMMEMFKT